MDFASHPLNKHQLPIGKNIYKPITNSQLVDEQLKIYAELITPGYEKWFAKQFYQLTPEMIARCAAEAKVDGKDPRRLFSFLLKKRLVVQ